MKILVVGGGGREHAIIRKLKESPLCGEIWCAPGNGGISYNAHCKNIKATDLDAMVAFANCTSSAKLLCDLMNYDMDIYTFESAETVEPTLRQLQKNDYHSILCDMIANTTAKRLGMNSFLITSGVDSIRKAFDQALLLC